MHDCKYVIVLGFFLLFFFQFPVIKKCLAGCGLCFEQAKSKCGQVTLLRAASMADQATACGQLANVTLTSLCSPDSKLEEWRGIFTAPKDGCRFIYENRPAVIL